MKTMPHRHRRNGSLKAFSHPLVKYCGRGKGRRAALRHFLPSAGFLPSAVPRRAANPRYLCARRQTATVAGWMPMAPNARHREWSADARLASHLHRMREETSDRGRVDRRDIRIAGNCYLSRACPFDCREGKGIFRKSKQSRGDKYECIVHICITLSDNRERVP